MVLTELETVILCGGQGTRLREETEFKPKPMVEIGGKPILWHIMKHYSHFGVRRFILCLGYKGQIIRDYFLSYHLQGKDLTVDCKTGAVSSLSNGVDDDWEIVLADTGEDTLTGTRIQKVLKYLKGQRFFATYGDGVADVDLHRLMRCHTANSRQATVTAVHPSSRFGELSIAEGMVQAFNEKPQVSDGWINGGYFVFERRAFDGLDPSRNAPLETGVLEQLADRHQLSVYQHDGFWQCMDTYREMQLLNGLWQDGKAAWKVWEPWRLTA